MLDNADDIDMLHKRAYSNSDCLPSSPHSSIVATTGTGKAAVKQARNNIIRASDVNQVDAREVLGKSLIQTDLLKENEVTVKLLDLM